MNSKAGLAVAAVAVLSGAPVAVAQTVQLYGTIDTGVEYLRTR